MPATCTKHQQDQRPKRITARRDQQKGEFMWWKSNSDYLILQNSNTLIHSLLSIKFKGHISKEEGARSKERRETLNRTEPVPAMREMMLMASGSSSAASATAKVNSRLIFSGLIE